MKKHLFSSLVKTIFLVWVGFVVLTLSSCENFMQGADVRSQLDKAVSFANAKNCSLFISQETEMGTFLSSGEKECKIGYSVEIVFYLNKDYYVFKNLKAVSVTDESQSRDDYVEFTINQEESDIEKGLYRVSVKLLKEANDIKIIPDCIELPKVLSYSPASSETNYANTPVVITFNMPINSQTLTDNFKVSFNDIERTQDFFYEPVLSNDNRVVTILPKGKDLKTYIEELKTQSINLKFFLSPQITATIGEVTYPLVQDANSDFTICYEKKIEETPPQKEQLFVTRHEINLEDAEELVENKEELFNNEDIGTPPSNVDKYDFVNNVSYFDIYSKKVLQNRTGGKVYIYGKYTDKDSGVRSVSIEEERTNNWYSLLVKEEPKSFTYMKDSKEAEFTILGDTTYFCIPYEIKSDDGAVKLRIKVTDAAGNSTDIDEFTAIKKSKVQITNCHEFGTPGSIEPDNYSPYYTVLLDKLAAGKISIKEYNEAIKIVKDYIYIEDSVEENEISTLYWLYDYGMGINMLPKEVKCQYIDKDNKTAYKVLTPDDYWTEIDGKIMWWYGFATLDDAASLGGQTLTFFVSDDLGNTVSKEVRVPSADDISWVITKKPNNKASVVFKGRGLDEIEYFVQKRQNNEGIIDCYYYSGSETEIQAGCKYQTSFAINGFLTEFNDDYYSISTEPEPEDGVGEVKIESYTIEKATVQRTDYIGPYLDVHITLSDESLTKYDSFYINFKYQDTVNGNTFNRDFKTYINKEADNKLIFQLPTRFFYLSATGVELIVHGIVNQYVTPGSAESCKITIARFTQGTANFTNYDNYPPDLAFDKNSDDENLIITAEDIGSGLQFVQYVYEQSKTYLYTTITGNFPKTYIPFSDFVIYGKINYGFDCYAFDNVLNCEPVHYNLRFCDYPSGYFTSIKKNTSNWSLKTDPCPSADFFDISVRDITVYTLQTIDGLSSWKKSNISTSSWDYNTNDSSTNGVITTVTADNLPENQYVRIITALNDNHSPSSYLFTGDPGSGQNDLFLPGGFENTYAIVSDAPVFVHTLVTSRPYEECKDWSAKEWEYYKKHLGEQVLNFTSNNTGVQAYTAPVSSNDIKPGECYIVIAHYATGRTAMSPVMVKE